MLLNRKIISSILLVNTLLLSCYFYKFNTYTSDLIIYPTSELDTLKVSAMINSNVFHLPAFQNEFQDYLQKYLEKHELFSSNSETKIFILNDMIAAAQSELKDPATSEYLNKYNIEGFFLKYIATIKAQIAIEARLNAINPDEIYKELSGIKSHLIYMIGYNKYLLTEYDIEKLNSAWTSAFHESIISSSLGRIKNLEQGVSARVKMLPGETVRRRFEPADILSSFVLSTLLWLSLVTFIQLISKDENRK
jgi:hypothetical protein